MNPYTWLAVYNDGTILPNVNLDNTENSHLKINLSKLQYILFQLPNNKTISIGYKPGYKFIYRRRVKLHQSSGTDKEVIYLLGLYNNTNGNESFDLTWIFEDGRIFFTDRFLEGNEGWFAPIIFFDQEK